MIVSNSPMQVCSAGPSGFSLHKDRWHKTSDTKTFLCPLTAKKQCHTSETNERELQTLESNHVFFHVQDNYLNKRKRNQKCTEINENHDLIWVWNIQLSNTSTCFHLMSPYIYVLNQNEQCTTKQCSWSINGSYKQISNMTFQQLREPWWSQAWLSRNTKVTSVRSRERHGKLPQNQQTSLLVLSIMFIH